MVQLIHMIWRPALEILIDPVKEVIIGDEEANRLVNPPMRAPWHL